MFEFMNRHRVLILSGLAALAVIAGVFYRFLLPGLSVADREPSAFEAQVATWLLHASVPEQAKAQRNPLGAHPDPAAVAAGRDLFRQKCELCHAYDGSGKTDIGSGAYPRPPALRVAAPTMPDGEIFYHIKNGIRNTAMPAWRLPDAQIWQLVAYIRELPG
jgi:mono/diheme cytochrome c family protein